MKFHQNPSPNFGERRRGGKPDLIVIHYTAMGSADDALIRLCDPECEVSAHYLVSGLGEISQLVDEEKRAWHAGAGAWGACEDINSRSVGIELANDGCSPFAAAQMDALEGLLGGIMERWSIPPERVIGHSDMAPRRKFDPGRRFDWRRLALSGLSVWPDECVGQGADIVEFSKAAKTFGYCETTQFKTLLSAFRQRFRPWFDGPLDAIDFGLINDLAKRFPVDLSPPTT